MSVMIAIDTCVALWLAERRMQSISQRSRDLLAISSVYIPTMVGLEIDFMYQRNAEKNPFTSKSALALIKQDFEVVERKLDITDLCAAASSLSWTREPFDRLIVGEAMALKLRLITSDRLILKHYKKAIW